MEKANACAIISWPEPLFLNAFGKKKTVTVLLISMFQSQDLITVRIRIFISYTQADRDRMVRVETQVESLNSQVNRLEDKFDSYFMWGFGLVLMSIFGLIGFIIYDRRTTLAPVENKTERIIKVLKEAAEKDPILREALKNTALW